MAPIAPMLLAQLRQRRATRLREVSLFRRGGVALLVALLRQEPVAGGPLCAGTLASGTLVGQKRPASRAMALPEAA